MTTAARRRLEYLPLDELLPDERNPKGHAPDAIASSVERFGFVDLPVVDERTGRLVAGHGRREELLRRREAGEPAPDGVVVKSGTWLVPVVRGWASRDDDDAHAAGIALNRTGELGGWTAELAPMLEELARTDRGLEGVGYTPADLDDLLAGLASEPAAREQLADDEADSPIGPVADPVTRRGDLWICGDHRVMCGDCFDTEQRATLLDGVDVAAALMDPPFAIYGSASGITASVADDKMVRPFFEQLGRVLLELLPRFGHAYIHCDWRSYATLWDGFRSAGLTPKNCLVWDKGNFGLGSNWPNAHEFVAFFAKLPPDRTMTAGRATGQRQVLNHSNILRYPRVRGDDREHNAAKPVALLAEIIEVSTDPGGWVVDLFGGSGPVLAAGEATGRRTATMEYEPGWVDVILRRYQRITGNRPTRDGKAHNFAAKK